MQAKHAELSQKVAELTAGKAAEDDVAKELPDFNPENMTGDEIAKALPQIKKVILDLNKKLAQVVTRTEQSEAERHQQRKRPRPRSRRTPSSRRSAPVWRPSMEPVFATAPSN